MPPRRPLAPISANRRRNQELSNDDKSRIYGRALAGQSGPEIAAAESLPKSTINTTIRRTSQRHNVQNKTRSGRPKTYTKQAARRVLWAARKNPKWTYKSIREETRTNFSSKVLRSILNDFGIINWRCKKRPHLTIQQARLRLHWARAHRHKDWSTWLFSDECLVEKGAGKQRQWAFGYPKEKWSVARIETYPKGKQASIMVWAMIGQSVQESELIIMERDDSSPRNGYTASSYTDTLEEGLLPHYDAQTFQQDNAPIHNANHTRQWLQHWGIYVSTWPPYSPDLNPIEHVWFHLKQKVYELQPDLDNEHNKDKQREILLATLPVAWRAIRRDIITSVLESMPRRIQAVIDARGWQTKY